MIMILFTIVYVTTTDQKTITTKYRYIHPESTSIMALTHTNLNFFLTYLNNSLPLLCFHTITYKY